MTPRFFFFLRARELVRSTHDLMPTQTTGKKNARHVNAVGFTQSTTLVPSTKAQSPLASTREIRIGRTHTLYRWCCYIAPGECAFARADKNRRGSKRDTYGDLGYWCNSERYLKEFHYSASCANRFPCRGPFKSLRNNVSRLSLAPLQSYILNFTNGWLSVSPYYRRVLIHFAAQGNRAANGTFCFLRATAAVSINLIRCD